jgi:hypothetical protein
MAEWVDLLDSVNQKYDNQTSGLTADNAQDAIDEVVAEGGDVTGPPGPVTDETLAIYDGTTGKVIKEGGVTFASVISTETADQFTQVIVDAAPVIGDLLLLEKNTTGAKRHIDITSLPGVKGPASSLSGNVAAFADISGELLADGGVQVPSLVSTAVDDQFITVANDAAPVAQDKLLLEKTITGAKRHIFLGDLPGGGSDLTDAVFPTYAVFDEEVVADASVDFADGNKQVVDANANPAISLSSPGVGNFLLVINNSGDLATIAPQPFWDSGTPPVWAGTSILSLYHDGTDYYGSAIVGAAQ